MSDSKGISSTKNLDRATKSKSPRGDVPEAPPRNEVSDPTAGLQPTQSDSVRPAPPVNDQNASRANRDVEVPMKDEWADDAVGK